MIKNKTTDVELAGDLTLSSDFQFNFNSTLAFADTNISSNPESTIATMTLSVTSTRNTVIVGVRTSSRRSNSGAGTLVIQNSVGATVATTPINSSVISVKTLTATIVDEPIGTNVYNVKILQGTMDAYTWSGAQNDNPTAVALQSGATVVNAADTHDAVAKKTNAVIS